MTLITTLIAEDEPLAAEGLADWVKANPSLQLVAVCSDGISALAAIRDLSPSLVLMDINMPGMTGLEVLRALQSTGSSVAMPRVIFTTAYDEHALAAFELHAVDYLLKPFSQERFTEAIDHALTLSAQMKDDQSSADHLSADQIVSNESVSNESANIEALQAIATPTFEPLTRLMVRDQGKIFPLNVDQIEYFKSDTKYTAIAYKGRQFLVRLAINAFDERLDAKRFIKLQRSCIVNLDFVDSMAPDEMSQLVVKMRDGSQFTASREVSKTLRNQAL